MSSETRTKVCPYSALLSVEGMEHTIVCCLPEHHEAVDRDGEGPKIWHDNGMFSWTEDD